MAAENRSSPDTEWASELHRRNNSKRCRDSLPVTKRGVSKLTFSVLMSEWLFELLIKVVPRNPRPLIWTGVFCVFKGGDGHGRRLAKHMYRRLINQKGGISMVIALDDLELTCPHCKRTGEEDGKLCPKCDGKGVILTAQGNTLLHFIKKHLNE